MFFCKFHEISKNNFFIEHIRVTAFGLSFVNPGMKSAEISLEKISLKEKNRSNHWRFSIKKGVLS